MPTRTVSLNPIQRALLRWFGGSTWAYGKGTAAKLNRRAAESGNSIFGLAAVMNVFQSYTQLSHDRRIRYADYDAMDDGSPEIAQILSLYAQEVTAVDPHTRRVIWIKSEDRRLARKLMAFLDSLTMEERLWGTARSLAKYGDLFWLNLTFQDKTSNPPGKAYLRAIKWIHPARVDRIEDWSLKGFKAPDLEQIVVPGNSEMGEGIFAPWDFVHGRLMAYDNEDIYGKSMVDEVRKIWKMLQILETMAALAHVQSAVDRHIIKIDITGLSEEEAQQLVDLYKRNFRKKEFFDPETGQFKSDFNPVTIQEDLFWPIREGDLSNVDRLQGRDVPQGLVDDLNYFRNKLCSGLGVPKEYVDGTQSGGVFDSKAALVLQDVHFARKMVRLQNALKRLVQNLCEVYLIAQGEEIKTPFTVEMTSLSTVLDILNEDRWLKRAEVLNQLAPLAETMGWSKVAWSHYLAKDVLKDLPPEVLPALLAGDEGDGVDPPDLGIAQDGDGGDEPGASHFPKPGKAQTSRFLPSPKPDGIASTLYSSGSEDLAAKLTEAFGANAPRPADHGADLRVDFERIKRSFVERYPDLSGLAERLTVTDEEDR